MNAWRVGNHYGIHVYDGDRPVATFLRSDEAMRAVHAVNTNASSAERLHEQDVIHADLVAILAALDISDHARPYSPHEVVQREVLPAIRALRDRTEERVEN